MKARRIRKIKDKMKPFLVLRSFGWWGEFTYEYKDYTEVMARTHEEAAYRYMKRTHALEDFNNHNNRPQLCNVTFAKLRVVPKDTPYDRHVKFYR